MTCIVILIFLSFRSQSHTQTVQPQLLIIRFMFNLRQVSVKPSSTNSDSQHFSRFSIANLRISSDRLGNISEPLDYGESLRLQQDTELNDVATDEVGQDWTAFTALGKCEDCGEPVVVPFGTRWDDGESGIAASTDDGLAPVPPSREKEKHNVLAFESPRVS